MPTNVLVIGDGPRPAPCLLEAMRALGCGVRRAPDAFAAMAEIRRALPDVAIVMAPGAGAPGDPWDQVCRRLGALNLFPIVVAHAGPGPGPLAEAAKAGASECLALGDADAIAERLGALVRLWWPGTGGRLRHHDLVLDELTLEVWRGAERIRLKAREFAILRALIAGAGEAVPAQALIAAVWGEKGNWASARLLASYARGLAAGLDQAGAGVRVAGDAAAGFRLARPPVGRAPGQTVAFRPRPASAGGQAVQAATPGLPAGARGKKDSV